MRRPAFTEMGEGESNERTSEVKTSHPGRWAGVIKQFDGETGNLLDTSEIQLWVGQQGMNLNSLGCSEETAPDSCSALGAALFCFNLQPYKCRPCLLVAKKTS
jgi:hypothetical protein